MRIVGVGRQALLIRDCVCNHTTCSVATAAWMCPALCTMVYMHDGPIGQVIVLHGLFTEVQAAAVTCSMTMTAWM